MIWNSTNQNKLFQEFEDSLQGPDYAFSIDVWLFDVNPGSFSFNDLSSIDPNTPYPILGTVELIKFDEAIASIRRYLSYKNSSSQADVRDDEYTVQSRLNAFWSLIEKLIKLPPSETYEHKTFYQCRFGFGVIWNSVYIFISGNKGLLVAMGAVD